MVGSCDRCALPLRWNRLSGLRGGGGVIPDGEALVRDGKRVVAPARTALRLSVSYLCLGRRERESTASRRFSTANEFAMEIGQAEFHGEGAVDFSSRPISRTGGAAVPHCGVIWPGSSRRAGVRQQTGDGRIVHRARQRGNLPGDGGEGGSRVSMAGNSAEWRVL